ncbi:hypothetical protein HUS23_00910 [Ectothiorhodospiraceae bacterium 2226]|nr:hypothetical protein HUS23_00910 [Ectothiorhodospiraceae bacterium 2226]
MTDFSALEKVTRLIEEAPHGGAGLMFYALVKTLSTEKGGAAYLLVKLREFTPEERQLAYGLMELMASGASQEPEWGAAVARMDTAMRG